MQFFPSRFHDSFSDGAAFDASFAAFFLRRAADGGGHARSARSFRHVLTPLLYNRMVDFYARV